MKVNNVFNVKEKQEKKLILEEERIKNPFLLFLKRHKNFILVSIIMMLICLFLVSTGIAFSLFRGSNDYDITYIEGSETIDSNNNPEVDDEEVEEELLGEIAREEGILLLVKTIMTGKGDVISYYTDGTAIVVQSDGKIYRISTNEKKQYGINENGKIDSTAKKILVTSNTNTLQDGTIITYYSDGSAKIEYKSQTYFVRDSNNIKIENETSLDNLAPSGVAPTKENKRVRNNNAITFTNKTHLVTINGKKYIVNKSTNVIINESEIEYDTKNAYKAIGERKYIDGNTITHFENGAAIITDPKGNVTYVKKSGDILLKKDKLQNNKKYIYEILPNPAGYSNSRTTIRTTDGKRVTYFDNAAAIIINQDGKREYSEDNDDILYDNNKNISSNPVTYEQIDKRVTEDGNTAYVFANGKTQVVRENGTSYVTETSELTFKPEKEEGLEKPEIEEPSHGTPNEDLSEGIEISEAENTYNDFMNVEDTIFIINNKNKSSRTLRITIEEVSNYQKYNTSRLEPKFVKFQATVGDDYVSARSLTENTWINSEGITNYTIYEGTINAKQTVKVALSLYVDYASLNNSHQNKGFIGTIRIYVDDSFLENE